MKEFDVIIIGTGPAGLSAAIYCSRKKLSTLVIGKQLGGQIVAASAIENYPGIERASGAELIKTFFKQATGFGAKIAYEEVLSIKKVSEQFLIKTNSSEYKCKALILAFGKTPRSLNVKGETKLIGKGVSYCVTCDGPFFKGKNVAVIGGGNSAIDAILFLSKIAKKVFSMHRRDEFVADESLIEEAKKTKNIEFIQNVVVKEFKGKEELKSILVENLKTKKQTELKIDGCFIEIGSDVKTEIVKGFVKLDKIGHIIVNEKCETTGKGIFAAGDITNVPFKQIIVAAGEGAKAALQTYNYIKGINPKSIGDWKHQNLKRLKD